MWERNLKYSNRWKSLIWSFSAVVLSQLELWVNEQKPIKSQNTRIASPLPPSNLSRLWGFGFSEYIAFYGAE